MKFHGAGMETRDADDPRYVVARLHRRTDATARTAAGSAPWIIFTALICSEITRLFGNVSAERAGICVAIIVLVCLVARLALLRIRHESTAAHNSEAVQTSARRAMHLDLLMSTAWGLVPWLLWEPGNLANHILLELVLLSVGMRFLVSRAGTMGFFLASFGPMAALLFLRLLIEWTPADMVLAAIVPFYGANLVFDARRHTAKSFTDAQLRFGMEDMARELEMARDEALRGRAEAEAANGSKTLFLANMSHELRTPLNAILGFSEIISRECFGPVGSARYREYAGDIHNSSTHLLSLINDLLDVAKIESGKMEISPTGLHTLKCLESVLKFVALRARDRRQSLTIDVSEDATFLYADERALRQIVINLVSNSVKFTPEGGKIEVRARHNASGDFELLVWDNGPGIPQDRLEQIFEPFSQINNKFDRTIGGTGLGLSLVRGLAELHGGRAWIECEPGKGTSAYVTIPVRLETIWKRAAG